MADFIMSLTDRAQIQVVLDGASPNAGLTFEALESFRGNADVSPDGHIMPKHPGLVAINVKDTSGNVVRELLGVIRTRARFDFDRSLTLGQHNISFLVTNALTGLNLGSAVQGGVFAVMNGTLPPGTPVPRTISAVSAVHRAGTRLFDVTWNSTATSAPYRVDLLSGNSILISVSTGALSSSDLAATLDVFGISSGTYTVRVTDSNALDTASVDVVVDGLSPVIGPWSFTYDAASGTVTAVVPAITDDLDPGVNRQLVITRDDILVQIFGLQLYAPGSTITVPVAPNSAIYTATVTAVDSFGNLAVASHVAVAGTVAPPVLYTFGGNGYFASNSAIAISWTTPWATADSYLIEVLDSAMNVLYANPPLISSGNAHLATLAITANPGAIVRITDLTNGQVMPLFSLAANILSSPSFATTSGTAAGSSPANAFDLTGATQWVAGTSGAGSAIGQLFPAPAPPVLAIEWVQGANPATAVHLEVWNGTTWMPLGGSIALAGTPGGYEVVDVPPASPNYPGIRVVADALLTPSQPWSVTSMSFWDTPGDGFGTGPYGAAPYGT